MIGLLWYSKKYIFVLHPGFLAHNSENPCKILSDEGERNASSVMYAPFKHT